MYVGLSTLSTYFQFYSTLSELKWKILLIQLVLNSWWVKNGPLGPVGEVSTPAPRSLGGCIQTVFYFLLPWLGRGGETRSLGRGLQKPPIHRVSQTFVPLITCDITSDRNYTSTWNFSKTFIALLSTYIRKVNIRHALLCLLSRSEAVAAWSKWDK